MSEEKSLIKKDYRQRLSNERHRLSKRARARSTSRSFDENRYQKPPNDQQKETLNDLNTIPTELNPEPNIMVKEINDLFQNTCQIIKNMEKESELFEKSIELDMKAKQRSQRKITSNQKKEFLIIPQQLKLKHKQDLNNCQKLNLTESSSNENYNSTSFEDDINDD